MKKLKLVLLGVAIVVALALFVHEPQPARADAPNTPYQLLTTNASTTVPVQLYSTSKPFRTATLIGNKDQARTANTGNVWIGLTSTNNQQPVLIQPGETITVSAPPGSYFDLRDWYLDVATANDGVVIIYTY